MIIDSQVHIWAPETPDRPWIQGGAARAQLSEPFGYEDLLVLMNQAGVDRAILVPPSWEGDRVDFALQGVAKYPDRFAVMGRIPLADPESRALLPDWRKTPGLLGFRFTFFRPEDRLWLTDGTADWVWPELENAGIPAMVYAPDWLPQVGEIARRHPKLKIIVDHLGLYRQLDGEVGPAVEQTMKLAVHPNISVKVSTLPYYSTEPYPFRNLHEPLRRLIEAFGPRRSFWGTDFSRLIGKVTYRQCVTMFTEELSFLSDKDKEWVMGRGLSECLEWPN